MIFNTTTKQKTGVTEVKTNFDNIADFFTREYILPDSDMDAIKEYNDLINASIPSHEAFSRTMQDASKSAQKMVQDANGNTIALERLTKAATASSIGMKALSTIGNIAAFALIAKVIQTVADTVDNFAHLAEYAREDISGLESEYQTTCSELEAINSELETTRQRMEELESKGHLTLTEETELNNLKAQNNELERNLALKQKENEIKAEKTVAKIADEKEKII